MVQITDKLIDSLIEQCKYREWALLAPFFSVRSNQTPYFGPSQVRKPENYAKPN